MSWRDSENPQCPECGEEISPTATYCMHCYADLPTDGDADVDESDDVERSEVYGSESDGDSDSDSDSGSAPEREDVYGSESGGDSVLDLEIGSQSSEGGGGGTSGSVPNPHSLDGVAGALAGMIWTDVPEGGDVSADAVSAPLWMRAPVGIFAGFFVFFAFLLLYLIMFNEIPMPGNFLIILGGFVGIMWWLVRKPLPSDIVGDACYGIALLLLAMPVAFLLNRGLQTLIGAGSFGLQSTLLFTVGGAFVALFPACFFLVVGFVGNRYARSKLDSKAENAADAAGN